MPLLLDSVRQLLYYDCIMFTDIFQYSNYYTTTPQIALLAGDSSASAQLRHDCIQFISKPGARPATPQQVVNLYCSLRGDLRFSDFCNRFIVARKGLRIDARRFVLFGVLHRFICRLHEYPICDEVLVQDSARLVQQDKARAWDVGLALKVALLPRMR